MASCFEATATGLRRGSFRFVDGNDGCFVSLCRLEGNGGRWKYWTCWAPSLLSPLPSGDEADATVSKRR